MTIVVGRGRNWPALLALWTALATWLLLMGGFVAGTFADENFFDWLGWVALGFGTAALVLAVGGITVIRTRGETAVAVLALVLLLSLSTLVSPWLFYGIAGFG